jgi:uncharacterized protein (TIGR04255 family)
VLGIQFATPPGYQQIYAGEVWALFRDEYPNVGEQPPLPPGFETWGLPQAAQLHFGIVTGASHDRFWFQTPKNDELIQFQNDRFLHNWRQDSAWTHSYPRFKALIAKFEQEVTKFDGYMRKFAPDGIAINQCEVTYTNHISIDSNDRQCHAGEWLKFLNIDDFEVDDFNCIFRRTVLTETNEPYARLTCQAGVGVDAKQSRIILLNLTFRGRPRSPNINGAIEFLDSGHHMIVDFFTQITTNQAHAKWERTQ